MILYKIYDITPTMLIEIILGAMAKQEGKMLALEYKVFLFGHC